MANEKRETFMKGHNTCWYEKISGMLFRIYQCHKPGQTKEYKQLLLPRDIRDKLMKLAHETILASHMGIKKTIDWIMSGFPWPGIQSDGADIANHVIFAQRQY